MGCDPLYNPSSDLAGHSPTEREKKKFGHRSPQNTALKATQKEEPQLY